MNPFRETIVGNPWESTSGDVPAIHAHVFDECLRGLQQVRESQHSAALLIHGAAGSGKTHLLRRLRERLALKHPTATDRDEALYVWVRLQTSPRMIWRTVRRTLVEDWFRPLSDSSCQFDRILFHRLAEIRVAEGDLEPWYEYLLQEDPEGLRELIDQIATTLNLDRNTHVAFEHLAFGRHRRDLRAWLSGDSLPEVALERMELTQDDGNDEEREDQARQVVLMLCRLAGNELPIVLSFDQVEALELNPGDNEALFAFGQLVSTLHDGTSNVLIISSVQSSFADRLNDRARAADRDRMKSLGARSLAPLSRDEARELIHSRLQAAGERIPEGAQSMPFWPLSAEDVDNLVQSNVTPRSLLARCAEAFDAQRPLPSPFPEPALNKVDAETVVPPPEAATSSVSTYLDEKWQALTEDKIQSNTPAATEDILRHALPMAVRLIVPDVKVVQDEHLRDVSLVLEGTTGRMGVSICTQSNMTSLAGRLKRLNDQFNQHRVSRMVIVRDARVPITSTARKAQASLNQLEQKGASVVYPSVDVLAALDVLRALLSDAKSGDLSHEGETVLPRTVEEWFIRHLPHDLNEFLEQVIGVPNDDSRHSSETAVIEALNTILVNEPVVQLNDVATQLGSELRVLTETIRRHPDQLGMLGEPPSVLFRATESTERGQGH